LHIDIIYIKNLNNYSIITENNRLEENYSIITENNRLEESIFYRYPV